MGRSVSRRGNLNASRGRKALEEDRFFANTQEAPGTKHLYFKKTNKKTELTKTRQDILGYWHTNLTVSRLYWRNKTSGSSFFVLLKHLFLNTRERQDMQVKRKQGHD